MIKSTLLQSRNSILCLSAVYDQINATAVPQYFVCACVCVCPLLLLLYLQLSSSLHARPRSCARAHTQPTPPTWFSDFCASIKSWNNVPESKTFRNLLCVVTVFALMIFKRHSRELPQISVYSSHGCKNVTFWNNRICKVKQTFLCFSLNVVNSCNRAQKCLLRALACCWRRTQQAFPFAFEQWVTFWSHCGRKWEKNRWNTIEKSLFTCVNYGKKIFHSCSAADCFARTVMNTFSN